MNNLCPHCGEKFFLQERNAKNIFTKCCFEGKVPLPPILPPSHGIVNLYNGESAHLRHFHDDIRQYNSTMAMASLNATLREQVVWGPRVMAIHGQAYHLMSAVAVPPQGQQLEYAPLYMLDTQQAVKERFNDPRNQNL